MNLRKLLTCIPVLLALCAALPAAAQNTATIPPPGTTPMRVEIQAADGVTLVGDLYNAELNVQTPAVLLMHMLNGSRNDWSSLVPLLVADGYRVLAVDLRGHGESGGRRDWTAAAGDVQGWLNWMHSQPSIIPDRIAIVGGSIGANLALVGCANDDSCVTVVALSPAVDYLGMITTDAIRHLHSRSALLMAARHDPPGDRDIMKLAQLAQGEIGVQVFGGAQHGTALLGNTVVPPMIVVWLETHLR